MHILLEGSFLCNSDLESGSRWLWPSLCFEEQPELQAGLSTVQSPKVTHTFITAWARHGESTATAACCCSCLLAQAETRADPSPWHASLVSSWCNGPAWKSDEKLHFSTFFLLGRKKKIIFSCRILTLNLIIIIREQPWLQPVSKIFLPLHGFSISCSLQWKALHLSNTLLHFRHLYY